MFLGNVILISISLKYIASVFENPTYGAFRISNWEGGVLTFDRKSEGIITFDKNLGGQNFWRKFSDFAKGDGTNFLKQIAPLGW